MNVTQELQKAEKPNRELDKLIADTICYYYNVESEIPRFTSDYTFSIKYIEKRGFDWVMGNVNGQVGGTPYAHVGVPYDKSSYSGTPLLSLWLSYIRTNFGDERE
jgi:hypothetical protein